MVSIPGQMAVNIKASGPMANRMVLASIFLMMVALNGEFGKMERDRNGSTPKTMKKFSGIEMDQRSLIPWVN